MRKLTIAEKREKELYRAMETYNMRYDDAKHIMNVFYRLNANLDRLLYLKNDERTCNMKSTKNLSDSCDRSANKLRELLKSYELDLKMFGHLYTIVELDTTKTAIYDYYYE